jgi:NitT/TauT family transport system substrate-binding protein
MSGVRARLFACVATVVLVTGLAACGSSSGSAGSTSGSGGGDTSVKLAVFPGVFDYLMDNMAASKQFGFFKKNGLNVSLVSVTGGPALSAALTGGSVQIGAIPVSNTFPLAQKGVDVKFLMNAFDLNFDLVAQKGLVDSSADGSAQLASLKGKTIGVASVGGGNWFWVQNILKAAGVDPDSVHYIAIGGNATGVAAFKQKRIDALVAYPPILQQLPSSDYDFVAPDLTRLGGKAFDGFVNAAYTTTGSYLEKNKPTVDKFCTAIKQTRAYAMDPANESKVVSFVATFSNVSQSVAAQMWKTYKYEFELPLPESRWNVGKPFLAPTMNGFYPDYSKYVYQGCAA